MLRSSTPVESLATTCFSWHRLRRLSSPPGPGSMSSSMGSPMPVGILTCSSSTRPASSTRPYPAPSRPSRRAWECWGCWEGPLSANCSNVTTGGNVQLRVQLTRGSSYQSSSAGLSAGALRPSAPPPGAATSPSSQTACALSRPTRVCAAGMGDLRAMLGRPARWQTGRATAAAPSRASALPSTRATRSPSRPRECLQETSPSSSKPLYPSPSGATTGCESG
mmetsp:Transcript_18727/g.42920  ORF Transcript_18727/g.42920 Transcript_18727/m.42920 type:complete len:222 (+) Transcript_18727:1773-2438(+)